MKYNIWNKWDPLKACMLGNNYAPEFFDGVDDKVADPLKRICEETLEDLEGYKTVLQDFGVEVIQPEMDPRERFLDNPHRYPRGPLQPRDAQLVLGNNCFSYGGDHPAIIKKLQEYGEVKIPESLVPAIPSEERYNFVCGADWPSWEEFLSNRQNQDYFEDFVWEELLEFSTHLWMSSACCFMIGTKLFVGVDLDTNSQIQIKNTDVIGFEKFDIHVASMEGHTDGNFHPIKPGAILSLYDVQNYAETFPGWDVCYLPNQSWSKIKDFLKLKKKNQGKWWLAGEEDNDEFTNFVETWLGDWVGYVEETVFDVNVLMLDEHHCCVNNTSNEKVNAFLKKHKVEPVHVPFRHRFFWDGGLHCITLDLYREGIQKEYF
tara:strand:- start:9494 stop:10618 length:1125 start_codon:yes stop_codon:yes gene_type:complete